MESLTQHMQFKPGVRIKRLDTGAEAILKSIMPFSDCPLNVIMDDGTEEIWYCCGWEQPFVVVLLMDIDKLGGL